MNRRDQKWEGTKRTKDVDQVMSETPAVENHTFRAQDVGPSGHAQYTEQ